MARWRYDTTLTVYRTTDCSCRQFENGLASALRFIAIETRRSTLVKIQLQFGGHYEQQECERLDTFNCVNE